LNKALFLVLFAVSFSGILGFQQAFGISITQGVTPQDLANALGLPVSITDVQYTGATVAQGTVMADEIGIFQGIVLSSGNTRLVPSLPGFIPTNPGTRHGLPGSSLFDTQFDLVGEATVSGTTFDAAVLQITFDVPSDVDSMGLEFVFGSSEEEIGGTTQYADVFGIFLNGELISFDDDGNPIITSADFWFNCILSGPCIGGPIEPENPTDLSFLFFKTVNVPLTPGSTGNILQIAIADGGDDPIDTAAFVGVEDSDSDGDGVRDSIDLCPGIDDNLDTDGDGILGCLDENPTLFCGQGTTQIGFECVGQQEITCGAGTILVDDECLPDDSQILVCGPKTEDIAGFCVPNIVEICAVGTTPNFDTFMCFAESMSSMIGGELLEINTVSLLVGAIGTNPIITGLVAITLAGIVGQAAWYVHKSKKSENS